MSLNPEIDSDIPAMLGASAALALSGVPFHGPIAARQGRLHRRPVRAEPTAKDLKKSQARPRGRRHGRCGADGRVRSADAVRRGDARCRGVRPRADAGRHQGDQRTDRRGRQAGLGLEAPGRRRRPRGRSRRRRPRPRSPRPTGSPRSRRAMRASARSRRPPSRHWPAARAPKFDARRSSDAARHAREQHRPRPRPRRRAAHRRPRHEDGSLRSPSGPACCRVPTVRRCSPAARPRRWSSRRSAPAAMRRSSMRSPASAKSRSCSTTTSLRSASARPA